MRPGGGLKREAADAADALGETMAEELCDSLGKVSNVMLALRVLLATP